jgi:hypothetical protein
MLDDLDIQRFAALLERIADAQERIAAQAELTGKDIHRLAHCEYRGALLFQKRGG